MYGWRARIGLITPMSSGTEHAFHIYSPEGVTYASSKIVFPGPTPEGLRILVDQLDSTAAIYKNYDLDLVVFGCTAGSCINGVGFDEELMRRIRAASGKPGLTTSTTVLRALKALGSKKVAVLTPYPEDTNEAEKDFLIGNGYEVTNIGAMDMSAYQSFGGNDFELATESFLKENAQNFDLKGADTFFLSCMGLTTMEIIQDLEEKLGVPVITSHQATLWGTLREVGIPDTIPGLGKLFTI